MYQNTNGYRSQKSVTRPSNTTAYTAGDVVGATAAVIEFTNIGPAGGQIMLTSADVRIDVSAIPSGMTSERWHLYTATPPSALADNAVWDLPSGDRAGYIGYIDLGSPADLGSTLFAQVDGINKHVKLAANSTSLFAYRVTNGAYTPGSGDVSTLTLRAIAV
jgi:hypothetical protein